MYKIYINDRPLILSSQPEAVPGQDEEPGLLIARYTGKVKTLLHYADLLEKGSPKVSGVLLYHADLERLWQDFQSHYKIVAAAGGLVRLIGTQKLLFIFRRGYLDLPKGKIDEGETNEAAALREVREETGLTQIRLSGALGNEPEYLLTYHTYHGKKGKRILKPTYWFRMETDQQHLEPEAEEGIEWARFLEPAMAMKDHRPFYASLRGLLEARETF